MITFQAVFVDKAPTIGDYNKLTKYTFNTNTEVKKDTYIATERFSFKPMYIIEVLPEVMNYYNKQTKELTNTEEEHTIPLTVLDMYDILTEEQVINNFHKKTI